MTLEFSRSTRRTQLPFSAELLPLASSKGMGVIGMKIPREGVCSGKWGSRARLGQMPSALTMPVSG